MSLISLLSQFLHSCSISCTTLLLCCPLRHLNVRLHETVCVVYLVMTYNLSVNQKLNYCSEIFIKKRYRSLLSISEQLFKKSLLLIHQYEHKHWNLSTLIQANMLRLGGLILNWSFPEVYEVRLCDFVLRQPLETRSFPCSR